MQSMKRQEVGCAVMAIAMVVGVNTDIALTTTEHAGVTGPQNVLCKQIQSAMGIKQSDADTLKPLAQTLESYKDDGAYPETDVRQLVQALNKGAAPNDLSRILVKHAHVDYTLDQQPTDEKWKYGSTNDRFLLMRYLWQQAHHLEHAKPDEAHAFARAAVLLSCHADFTQNWLKAYAFAHDKKFSKLIGYKPIRVKRIRRELETYYKPFKKFIISNAKTWKVMDELIKAKNDAMPGSKVDAVIDALQSTWPVKSDHLGSQQELAHTAWLFLNLAKKRNDKSAIGKIERLIRNWRKNATTAPMKRWLDEALKRDGPAPTH